MIPASASTVAQLVHQQVVSDQQGVFHGLRGNLKSLHHEHNDKHGDDDGGQQRLQGTGPLGSRSGGYFSHDFAACPPPGPRVRLSAGGESKYSSNCRAAPCSASFFVDPSACPTSSVWFSSSPLSSLA